ncbi:sensor histidine kinase [Thermophagus sp. OGC60D27]|uniref:sensor histidine kinase n=1 Tax=Thermophagus sp. OGC60D27 TaxID=3458415 RepID=UPI0040377C21
MLLKINKEQISYKQLIWLLIILVLTIQINVITYNHFSGYYVLKDFQHFLVRLLRGCILSLIASFFIAYSDILVIQFLKSKAPWETKVFKRVLIELSFTLIIGVLFSVFFTLFANLLNPYSHTLSNVLLNNALIFSVVNILLISILEGLIFSRQKKEVEIWANSLKEELAQIKFELLKSQINPHFMFNSLNVLSGLISKDAKKAELFVDEFSFIYRYVLDTIEQKVSSLEKELDFIRSYFFLQEIRYGESLTYAINLPASIMNCFLPPLSFQIIIENAIKHNVVNESKPLHIDIAYEDDFIIISNKIQAKISRSKSTGIGLKNLQKRYALISEIYPDFYVQEDKFIAKLPLVKQF